MRQSAPESVINNKQQKSNNSNNSNNDDVDEKKEEEWKKMRSTGKKEDDIVAGTERNQPLLRSVVSCAVWVCRVTFIYTTYSGPNWETLSHTVLPLQMRAIYRSAR